MTKRTSDQFLEMPDDELEYELENVPVTESCDVVRLVERVLTLQIHLIAYYVEEILISSMILTSTSSLRHHALTHA